MLPERVLARTFTATLHIVHVVGNLSSAMYGADGYSAAMPELQQEIDDAARKQLDGLLVDDDVRPLPTRRVLLTSGAPAIAIVDYAIAEHINHTQYVDYQALHLIDTPHPLTTDEALKLVSFVQ